MIRTVAVSLAVVLLIGGCRAAEEVETAKSGGGGGDGYSQQYHYSSYPVHGGHGGYAGLSIDLGTGIFLAVGAIIVLLALAAILGPLSKGDGGWSRRSSNVNNGNVQRSLNVANLSEKVLSGIERIYDSYNKMQ